jgi:hypothetical protein
MLRDYDHGGSVDLRIDALSKMLFAYHTLQTTGGLITYVDRYQALMAEMDTIALLNMMMERNSDFGQECPPYPGVAPGTTVQG